uniref:Uncharacterized protein n=1 Tax=Oryza brachyantha TaxID=4533 RepID=J3LWS2_ORYBR
MVQYGDGNYDEERAVKKLFRVILEKYKQIAHSIESLLNLSTMSIEEVIGCLKVVASDEPQPLSGPITIDEKLHLTQEQWGHVKVTSKYHIVADTSWYHLDHRYCAIRTTWRMQAEIGVGTRGSTEERHHHAGQHGGVLPEHGEAMPHARGVEEHGGDDAG